MNIKEIRDNCLAKPGVTEGVPYHADLKWNFKIT